MPLVRFRASPWDPPLILAQMAALQALFYATLLPLTAVVDRILGVPRPTLEQLFLAPSAPSARDDAANEDEYATAATWATVTAVLLNALLVGLALRLLVGRAKQCLDFGATVHAGHLLATSIYAGFPTRWPWWLAALLSLAVSVGLGEYLCMRLELADIVLSAPATTTTATTEQNGRGTS